MLNQNRICLSIRERERERERENICSILSSVILNVCFVNFTCLLTLIEIYSSIVFAFACILILSL